MTEDFWTLEKMAQAHSLPDSVLQTLVAVMNGQVDSDQGGESVTLTVGGLLISGRIIPAWAFFEQIASLPGVPDNHWARRLSREQKESARVRRSLDDVAVEDYSKEQADEADREIMYIHLADARAFAPGAGPTPVVGTYWRGRLSDVSGWTFGVLRAEALHPTK